MGIWFFLTVLVAGNMVLKAYKWRLTSGSDQNNRRMRALELELQEMREKVQHLDDAVFMGDFELKRQFQELERHQSLKS